MGYSRDTIKGVSWMGALRVAIRGLTIIRLAILARLLSPYEFGLFGIAVLVLALLETVTETGINVFLIQKEGELKDYVSSAWLVSILRGLIITAVLLLFSSLISVFFNSPNALPLIRLMAIIPFLRGFINPSEIKFQKNLEFNKEFALRLSCFLADAAVSITLSLLTGKAVALIWGMAAGVVVELFISHIFISPKPTFVFEKLKVRNVFNRGKWITVSSIMSYFFSNGDNITVGKILNTSALGYYQMAYNVSMLPVTEISNIFYTVSFPVFTRFADDLERLKKAFVKVSLLVSVLVIPIGLILFMFTTPLVALVLGNKWLPIVPVLKILTFGGIVRAVTGIFPAVYLAVKKQEYATVASFCNFLGLAMTIVPLVYKFGIIGAGYSVVFACLISVPLHIYYYIKIFNRR
jgi:O-antigen/teichoic acid export membrane protein